MRKTKKFFSVFVFSALVLVLIMPNLTFASYRSWTKPRPNNYTGFYDPEMSKDGNYMAVAKADGPLSSGTFWFFKTKSKKPLWKFKTSEKIFEFALSKNGDYIAATGTHFRLFKKNSNQPLWKYYTHGYPCDDVAISDDGKYSAIGCRSGMVYLFDKASYKPIKQWKVSKAGYFVNDLAMSPDGRYIVVGSDANVSFIDSAKNKIIWKYKPKTTLNSRQIIDKVEDVSLSDLGNKFVISTHSDVIYYFNKNSKKPKWSYYNKDAIYNSVEISGDGKYITLAGNNKYLGFTPKNNKPKWNFDLSGSVPSLKQSSSGKYIAIADALDYVYLFDRNYAPAGAQRPFRTYSEAFPDELALSAKGDKLAFINKNLQFREIAPGVLTDLQDTVKAYANGSEMHLRMFVTNPGVKKKLNVKVRVSLPQVSVWETIGSQLQGTNQGLIPKVLGPLMEGVGGQDIYNKDFTFNPQNSKDIQEEITMPPLTQPSWYSDFFLGFDAISFLIDKLCDAMEYILPESVVNGMRTTMNLAASGGQIYPTIGLGTVIVSDADTGEVLSQDTFTFLFLLS